MGVADLHSFGVPILGDEMMDTPRQRAATGARVVSFPGTTRSERATVDEGRERQLLDTVLNNMSQGVLMFDPDARLVFCNRRYVEMYGLSHDVVRPGCTLRDLLDHRMAVQAFRRRPERLHRKADGRHRRGRHSTTSSTCPTAASSRS